VAALAVLLLWAAAITAGRLTAYDDANAQWQTAVGTLIVTTVLVAVGCVGVKLYGWIRAAVTRDDARETLKPQKVLR
jgi:hypothetical protein